ncbi:Trp biosynthesis-associated membrane protein [Allokutzneria oryzae]|uniref:Trp biosynthesis-associated membrane protein n=1 Tax=Allokutzneria oryzae TaxID=1378989 RepID=A0ABV5ZT47_9PSEU
MAETVEAQRVTPVRGLLWTVVLLLLASAGLLWGSSTLQWFSETDPAAALRASQDRPTGADQVPALVPLALLSLAGIAGAVATASWPRRLFGGLLALVGGGSVGLWFVGALDSVGTTAGAQTVVGPLLGLAGLTLLGVAGLVLLFGGGRMPAMGARYATGSNAKAADPDREVWDALDSGRDPTVTARKEP